MNHYFLGNQLIASALPLRAPSGSQSQAYFCPTCGDIWARLVAEDSEDYFDINVVYCERHEWRGVPGWGTVPGTLCQGSVVNLSTMRWIAAIEALPMPVLEREFLVLYQRYLRTV